MRGLFSIILAGCLFVQCSSDRSANFFEDTLRLRIADFQDRRLTDSLAHYLNHTNPIYRAAACRALASAQDTLASTLLGTLLLEDSVSAVREEAAFALGQTGGYAAVNALIPALQDRQKRVVREALEALGKTIQKKDLLLLLKFSPSDSLTQEGLAWAFYRLGLRNLADSAMATRESKFLAGDHTEATRLAAAQFFSRTKFTSSYVQQKLIEAVQHDPLPEVRMAAILGLRHGKAGQVLPVLRQIVLQDKDYRVRNNALRTSASFPLEESADIVFGALRDPSEAVQITASETILRQAKGSPFKRIVQGIASTTNVRVKANLYAAQFTLLPSDNMIQEMIRLYRTSTDYGKSQLLSAMGYATGKEITAAFSFLSSAMLESKVAVIRTNAALAIVSLNSHTEFFKSRTADFVDLYKKAILLGDPALTGIVSGALADSMLAYRKIIPDFTFLLDARKRLELPKDIESLQPLTEAIAYFEGRPKPIALKNTYNHPIPWELVRTIPGDQKVRVKTARGEIVLRLFVEETPGSVGNFVQLVRQKYFDGKFVHRVVPNFVTQTGCNRGDGYGSEAFSIRSEFSRRRYSTGSVGMASAGKDTEGTQWFITHSPTPHLDGRYTLFAEVVKGQNIVDQLQVGDTIETVSLIGN